MGVIANDHRLPAIAKNVVILLNYESLSLFLINVQTLNRVFRKNVWYHEVGYFTCFLFKENKNLQSTIVICKFVGVI